MLNINLVPDDYIQSTESHRTNLMYLVLFAIVMTALGGSFMTIKIQQRRLSARQELVNKKIAAVKESMKQFEQLQEKRKAMMLTALTTAELLEPVPKSVLLASLTNNLPTGVSLLRLNVFQKKPSGAGSYGAASIYKAQKAAMLQPEMSPERLLDTHIDIEGIAPSDIQVATYIERLGNCGLLDNVALVESKEHKPKDNGSRQFKLTAMLKKDAHISIDEINSIKSGPEMMALN